MEKKYINVVIRLEPRVYGFFRLKAAKECTKIVLLIEEALTTWCSWLYRASRDEADEYEREITAKEKLEADELLVATWNKQHKARLAQYREAKRKQAMRSQRAWSRAYPGRSWPGAKMRADNDSGTTDNDSGTADKK